MTTGRWIGLGIGVFLILAMIGVVAWQGSAVLNTAGEVLAQAGSTPTTTPPAKGPKTQVADEFLTALAKQLGIPVDELKTKLDGARTDVIDQWVKNGKITQDQANKLKERIKSAPGFGFPFFGRGPQGGPPSGKGPQGGKPPFAQGPHGGFGVDELGNLEAVAKVLKLAPADLTKQFRDGKTLAEIAKAQNVDEAAVKKVIIDSRSAQIDRAVQDGVLNKDQADKLKTNLTPDKIDLSKIGGKRGFEPKPHR